MPAITPLPTAPSSADPANFSTRADALLTALPAFATECNATAVAMPLNATNATSTTSLLIGLDSKSLTVQTAKSYVVGMTVKISSTASPTNWMLGEVTAYTTGTGALVVNVTVIQGAGTLASWNVMQSVPGVQTSGFRNELINGNFGVNQRAVTGTVTLAAGAYGHDRWKAGAGGCTYTFATALNVTTLTISAGTLIQVIEGINLQSGTYTLSWTGTAAGKIGTGALSASGITGTAVGGTNLNIEFNTGTLSKVQFEEGIVNSAFETRPYGMELALCQRYFISGRFYITSSVSYVPLPNQMRVNMTSAVIAGGGAGFVLADSNTSTGLICYQTTSSVATMTISAEL